MKSIRFIIAALLVVIVPAGHSLWAFIDYPYAVNFQTIRLPLLPLDEPLPEPEQGRFAVRLSINWINVWSLQRNYFYIDGEELQFQSTLRYRLSEDAQIGLGIPFKALGGGIMDSYIEGFHDLVNVSQGGRKRYPRNRLNVSYEPLGPYYGYLDRDADKIQFRDLDLRAYPRRSFDPPQGLSWNPLNPFQKGEFIPATGGEVLGAGDPRIFYQIRLWEGERLLVNSIVAGFQVKIPTNGNAAISSPGWDRSIFVTLHRDAKQGAPGFCVGVSYTAFESRRYLFLSLPAGQWVFRPSLEAPFNQRWSMLLEYVYFTSPVKNFGRLGKPGQQISAALRYRRDRSSIVFGAVENFGNFGVTPDIGFHMSYEASR